MQIVSFDEREKEREREANQSKIEVPRDVRNSKGP